MTKTDLEKKEFVSFKCSGHSLSLKEATFLLNQGQDLQIEPEAVTMEKWCLMSHSPGSWLSTFPILPESSTWGGATHNGMGPPTSIINQENSPQTCFQSDGDVFSVEIPFLLKWLQLGSFDKINSTEAYYIPLGKGWLLLCSASNTEFHLHAVTTLEQLACCINFSQ